LNTACSNGVEVNIADSFPEIGFFLAYNRFVTVLKEVASSAMSMVTSNDRAGKESSHESGSWFGPGPKKNVSMSGHTCPHIPWYLHLGAEILTPFNTIVAIFSGAEYVPSFYPPNHDS